MKRMPVAALTALLVIGVSTVSRGQNAAAPRTRVAGTVATVDTAGNQLSLHSDSGETMTVSTGERTLILRIPAGETDPKKGTKIGLADLAAGDRVVAVSRQPIQGSSVSASAILVMTKADVASVRQKEQEDWHRRGTTGTVTAVDPTAKTVTLKAGSRTVTVNTGEKTTFHRYSPDSARFADAKPSSLAEIKPGDQLRVLGNRNEDGTAVTAEKVVFGTFRQIAATIKSIDAAQGELTVTDLATKKPLIVRVNNETTMRKLPEMQARMLARRYAPGGQQAAPPPGTGGQRDGEGAIGGGRGGRGGRGGDIGQMLDALPAMPLSELKPGDAIMISTTVGSDPARVTAVTLLAGVEPLLTASPAATRDIMSGWNLGAGEGGESQ